MVGGAGQDTFLIAPQINAKLDIIEKHIKPDGTIIEKTSNDLKSESKITEEVKIQYEKLLAEQRASINKEYEKKISSRKKLNISGGYTSDMKPYGYISYEIWGPITINGGIIVDGSNTYLLGIGINL